MLKFVKSVQNVTLLSNIAQNHTQMKIYISGRISGQPNLNRGAFADAVELITNAGHEAVNPHDVCRDIKDDDERELWRKCMRKCIAELVQCDAMITLNGWEKSEGATLEVRIAHIIGMRVLPLTSLHMLNSQPFQPVFGC